MTDDKEFKPKLGKIRGIGSKRGRKYLHQVLRAVALAGGRSTTRKTVFHGSRSGRGAGVGRVLAARDKYAAQRQRRVIIKSRFVKIKTKGPKPAQLHLRYIQRDGVTREGLPGELYDATSEQADGKAFLARGEGDRHQFRFIVAAEDASEYQDLKAFTRQLMTRMEEDLGTRLDWVAVDHFNTGHAHTHIVLRGKDDHGKDLVIAREYISQGMRERAAEIISLDLGPRSDLEIEGRLRREVEQERLTTLDRRLLRDMDTEGIVGPPAVQLSPFQQTLRAGRLQKLGRMGLAEEIAPGRWQLAEGLEATLREMALRGDIIKTMNRELKGKGVSRPPTDYAIYDPGMERSRPLTGRVVARGLSDEINDRHYLIVDGADGYSHYVDIGSDDATEPTPEGTIVAISAKKIEPRKVDRTVAEIAGANGGKYSVDIHLRHDRTATAAFAESHVRRLEAMRRLAGMVERQPDGTWLIAGDHLDRAKAYEQDRARTSPVVVQKLSILPLERQVSAEGATWLDHELVSTAPVPLRDSGFGRAAREALDRRRQWLMELGLAELGQSPTTIRADLLPKLCQRELVRVGDQMSKELGLNYRDASKERHVSGVYRKSVDLVSGRFAVIEGAEKDFALVPWRPVLEHSLGKQVSGVIRGDTISWTMGRDRGGPAR